MPRGSQPAAPGPFPRSRLATALAAAAALIAGCGGDEQGPAPGSRAEQEQPTELRIGFNEDFLGRVHGLSAKEKVRLVRNAGGTMLRTSLDWRSLEPVRDRWEDSAWIAAAELYDVALRHGVTPIFVIGFAPDWAREAGGECGPGSGPGWGTCELPPRRTMDLHWAEYASEVARRFPEAIIEVWNEPNLTAFWDSGPQPERYADLFMLAERAVRAVAPETPVILAGLIEVKDPEEGMPIGTFLRRTYRARPQIAERADGINLQPYPGGTDLGPGSAFERAFDRVRAIRDEFGLRSTPLYVTEVGVSTAGKEGVTATQQALTMRRVLERVRAMPEVRALLFHRLLSPGDTTDNPWELGVSWLLPGSYPPPPRPVYCAFVDLAERLYPGCSAPGAP